MARTLRTIAKVGHKAGNSLIRWAATDHSGVTQRIIDMPKMGFLDTMKYLLLQLVVGIATSILAGLLMFLMLYVLVPILLQALFIW